MKPLFLAALILACAGAFSGCGQQDGPTPTFHGGEPPERLSDWGLMAREGDALRLSGAVLPYDLASPLFTDYAQKLRTVWTPDGAIGAINPAGDIDLPVGAVLSKTFYYRETEDGAFAAGPALAPTGGALDLNGARLVETRLLVRTEAGWRALPYIWNDQQSEAFLKRTGDLFPAVIEHEGGAREDFAYLVPNANQCAACHATDADTKAIQPIGLKVRHLNKPSTVSPAFNQLDHWVARGLVAAPASPPQGKNVDWTDPAASLDARARSYLDINCSHCHNPKGAADTSGLNLEPDAEGPAIGRCKAPIAAGAGAAGRRFDIVPGAPEASITVFRMETRDPGAMMPELGRSLTHHEGVALIADWIAAMEGGCG